MDTGYAYFETIQQAAIESAVRAWREDCPDLGVFAMVAEADTASIPAIQNIFSAMNVTVAGAVFPELVDGDTFKRSGVLLIPFTSMPPYILIKNLSKPGAGLDSGIRRLAGFVKEHGQTGRNDSLFLIMDAMIPAIGTILDNLYFNLADMVSYMGVNAGSETFKSVPCVFANELFEKDALLAFLLPGHGGATLEHGYTMPDDMITATSTSGNRVISIDWRPAFEVYAEMAKSRYGVEVTKENFYQMGVHFPFGILRADGEVIVRIPVALQDDGSLFCVGEIPENAILTLLKAPESGSLQTVNKVADRLGGQLGPLALTFYCAGRRLHLGSAAGDELRALSVRLAPSKLAGALSLGEIGSALQGGYPLFHNGTIVCSPWKNQ